MIRTFTIDGGRPLQSKNKVRKNNIYLLHVKEFTCIHLKLNQKDATNITGEGKAKWTSGGSVTLLFYNKISQIINCTSIESISPTYPLHHPHTCILAASNQSPFLILVHTGIIYRASKTRTKTKTDAWVPFPKFFFFNWSIMKHWYQVF